jgi:hypothetical protein
VGGEKKRKKNYKKEGNLEKTGKRDKREREKGKDDGPTLD